MDYQFATISRHLFLWSHGTFHLFPVCSKSQLFGLPFQVYALHMSTADCLLWITSLGSYWGATGASCVLLCFFFAVKQLNYIQKSTYHTVGMTKKELFRGKRQLGVKSMMRFDGSEILHQLSRGESTVIYRSFIHPNGGFLQDVLSINRYWFTFYHWFFAWDATILSPHTWWMLGVETTRWVTFPRLELPGGMI